MASSLQFYLFGNSRTMYEGQPLKVTRTIQVLLAYLLLNRCRVHSRDVLANLLWGNLPQDKAHNCLNTALWRLRRMLKTQNLPWETYLVTTPTDEVGFNYEADYWLDVAVFEDQASQIVARPVQAWEAADVEKLEAALQLYTGDLLEGLYYDWVLSERERLHDVYLDSLMHLMCYHELQGAYQISLGYGQRILRHDPLREDVHREMMQLYLKNGQRALAAQQYETCCEILALQLHISPAEETQTLYEQIVLGNNQFAPRPAIVKEAIHFQQIAQQLSIAMQSLDKAQEQFQRAIELAEQFKKA